MSVTEIVLRLSSLNKNKNINYTEIVELVNEVYNERKAIALTQKVALLATVLNFVFLATKNWLVQIEKFRYEICFDPLSTQSQKKRRRPSTIKKHYERVADKKVNITVDQILVRAVQSGMSQLDNSMEMRTPRREGIMPDNNFATTVVPPFESEIISRLNEDESAISKSAQKTLDYSVNEEKFMTYHKMLALNQLGPAISSIKPKIDQTVDRSQKRTAKKRKTATRDDEIYIQQGFARAFAVERLSTKVKMSKQLEGLPFSCFENRVERCNPILWKCEALKQQVTQKMSVKRRREDQNKSKSEMFMGADMVEFGSFSEQRNFHKNIQQTFIVNQENNPTITTTLQSTLTSILQKEFLYESQISFQSFCKKRKIVRGIKGELFYQLLQMNFSLDQPSPSTFGQILIHSPKFNDTL